MQIRWTSGANRNLNQVYEYIAEDSPNAAHKIVIKILKTVENLKEHPEIGRYGRVLGTRELVVSGTPFIVPYRVKANHIDILRVFHSAMQWPEKL